MNPLDDWEPFAFNWQWFPRIRSRTTMTAIKEEINPEKLLAHAADAERFLKQLSNKTRLMVLCSLLKTE